MSTKAKYDPLEAAKLVDPATGPTPDPAFKAPASLATTEPPPLPPPPGPSPHKVYRLTADKRASIRGQIIDFKAGREFSTAGYDIDNLKSQGLQLELIKE